MPSGTGAISPRLAASKSRVSANGSRGRHRRIGGPGRGLGVARGVEMRRRYRNGGPCRHLLFPFSPLARATLRARHGPTQALALGHPARVALPCPASRKARPTARPPGVISGKLLARLHQDGESIVLRSATQTRDHLLQADPETFFVTDHYLGYPMVLARARPAERGRPEKLLVRAIATKQLAAGKLSHVVFGISGISGICGSGFRLGGLRTAWPKDASMLGQTCKRRHRRAILLPDGEDMALLK